MTTADGRRKRKAAVLNLRLSKVQTLRTDRLVFLAVQIYYFDDQYHETRGNCSGICAIIPKSWSCCEE